MSGALVRLGLNVAIVGAWLAYANVLHFGIPMLAALFTVGYIVVFTGFCFVARLLTTSLIMVPFIAVKLQLKLVSLLFAFAARGLKPMFPEWTLAYELTISMMRYIFVKYGNTIVNANTHLMREPFAAHGRLILASNCRKHNTVSEKLVANGLEHTWQRDPEPKGHRIVVIHYHGGGYCISDPVQDVELANQTHTMLKQILLEQYKLDVSVDVLLANYRKASEHLYPRALNDCFEMYNGDSAGAEMSLTNCMRLRKQDPELQPVAVLCYSPMVDFNEMDTDSKAPYCILVTNFTDKCIATYLRGITDPEKRRLASAINQGLRDLPPIFLQWGDLERFYDQGLRFKAKADMQGVTNMELDILKNMVHDPVMFPTAVSPAAETGIHNTCVFAARHLAPVLRSCVDPEPEPQL